MNLSNEVCGRTDIPLTQTGKMQAEQAAQNLWDKIHSNGADKLPPVTKIVASPLIRTQQTAGIIAKKLNKDVSLDQRLIEQDYGAFEGKDCIGSDFRSYRKQFAVHYTNGESMLNVVCRLYNFLDELIQNSKKDDHVILVSHGGVSRAFMTYFKDVTYDEYTEFRAQNCGTYTFTVS